MQNDPCRSPIPSMYGIFTYIWLILLVKYGFHVGKYTSPIRMRHGVCLPSVQSAPRIGYWSNVFDRARVVDIPTLGRFAATPAVGCSPFPVAGVQQTTQGRLHVWKIPYLEPKWGPLFCLKFGPCFGGLTFKHGGHLGSRYL